MTPEQVLTENLERCAGVSEDTWRQVRALYRAAHALYGKDEPSISEIRGYIYPMAIQMAKVLEVVFDAPVVEKVEE